MYRYDKKTKTTTKNESGQCNLKPMLLTDSTEIPVGNGWLYETKYDGFRCLLAWEKGEQRPVLKSRNNHLLNPMFPEIIQFCEDNYTHFEPYLPLLLDGELVYLTNNFQSNFSIVQKRGRMKNAESIKTHAKAFPCHYIAFDLLKYDGKLKTTSRLNTRKELLTDLFETIGLPKSINYKNTKRLQVINVFEDATYLWQKVKTYNGEGIIAKKSTSKWQEDTRSKNWLKIKHWKHVMVILTKFDSTNHFFHAAIYKEDELTEVVTFKHGLSEEESKILIQLFKKYGTLQKEGVWELPASICVTVACIDFDGSKLREPKFHTFNHNVSPETCNWQQMQRQLHPIPESVVVTHPDKPIFKAKGFSKDDYLLYLQKIAPYMLPFLQDRLLTVIRYPHGVPGESFYQKNYENIPEFVHTHFEGNTNFAVCNNIETLLWLGNQLALEFHIPFQPILTEMPTEIVFDLDPPSVDEFHLAVHAALKMKVIFDQFQLKSFIKTSGGKGMQIYIPLPMNRFSYEETGIFTEFVCKFLVQQYPNMFTIERLKKNRGKKLYLDYVQHREGKTIIAPYSTRGNENGLVATPLNWKEVNEQLRPEKYTIHYVMERIVQLGDPFNDFREIGEKQAFQSVLNQLKGLS